jgi:DNA helicase II / ATP-dependent DNA helicase PcrA
VLGEGARSTSRTADRRAAGAKPGRVAKPARCRSCGADLITAASRKIGRCDDCPPTYDEATFEALRTWRATVASETKVPAYVVFTDATLTAIAERKPSDVAALATISGVGAAKLARFGESVLSILGGADPVEVARNASAASKSEALDSP